MNYVRKTPCDFCVYKTKSGCMAKENSPYCRDAKSEFFRWIEEQKRKRGK